MLSKVIGGAVVFGLAALLLWGYGKAQHSSGQLKERAAWEKRMAAEQRKTHKLELELANRPVRAMTVYVDRVTKLQPIIQHSKETVREYAKTADGQRSCLTAERVSGIIETRRALFPGIATTTGGSPPPLPPGSDDRGAESRR
jgi:hypothetical protein